MTVKMNGVGDKCEIPSLLDDPVDPLVGGWELVDVQIRREIKGVVGDVAECWILPVNVEG